MRAHPRVFSQLRGADSELAAAVDRADVAGIRTLMVYNTISSHHHHLHEDDEDDGGAQEEVLAGEGNE
jgi:hypothetical protein